MLVIVGLFKRPIWTYKHSDWNDSHKYPTSGIQYIPPEIVLSIEILGYMVMLLLVVMEIGSEIVCYRPRTVLVTSNNSLSTPILETVTHSSASQSKYASELHWKDQPSRFFHRCVVYALLVAYILKLVDLLIAIYIFCYNQSNRQVAGFNFSPIEIVFIILIEYKRLPILRFVLQDTLPRFALFFSVLLTIIVLFTSLGLLLFDPNLQEGKSYFGTFRSSMWTLLLVMSGSNWPDPIIPAYSVHESTTSYI